MTPQPTSADHDSIRAMLIETELERQPTDSDRVRYLRQSLTAQVHMVDQLVREAMDLERQRDRERNAKHNWAIAFWFTALTLVIVAGSWRNGW